MSKELEKAKKEINELVEKINNISRENNLILDINTYQIGSINQGNFTNLIIKIYKGYNMCECCKYIGFLKEIYDKRFRIETAIISKSKGGTTTHKSYKLNYCPMCGRKLSEGE